ncbi:helix-turn-helix domain-containing protein [Rhodanobacter ginsengisoli]|uniref:Helix-turn-helix domain-containing protein n=1 Tax=Rhodanobacter ginsengisoli TaxID=418646 RepID=A0ABW0QKL4_9GAMM
MSFSDHISPINRRVAVLVYDGLCMFEFSSAAEVFGLMRPEAGPDWYRFETASIDGGPVATQFGGQMTPNGGLRKLQTAGTIIVPGWSGQDVAVPDRVIKTLRTAHARGARLMSICSGVFVLAATGLLDHQRATTHWRYAASLHEQYPLIDVDPNVLYVDNGSVLTSAGSAAGLDLCLHLIRRDFGSAKANMVARRLVIPPHREGGQAQYVPQPIARDQLAASVGMTERTFLRRFKATTGTSPGDWLTEVRVQHARGLLERTTLPIDLVAERSGFGSAITLRHHFRSRLQTSPVAYRNRFHQTGAKE